MARPAARRRTRRGRRWRTVPGIPRDREPGVRRRPPQERLVRRQQLWSARGRRREGSATRSPEMSESALRRAIDAVQAVKRAPAPPPCRPRAPTASVAADNPIEGRDGDQDRGARADRCLRRAKEPRVKQVSATLSGSAAVEIVRPDGARRSDVRPLVRLNVSVVVGDGQRMESGSFGAGGPHRLRRPARAARWRGMVDEAVREALTKLESVAAPAGEMTVVLGPGWPGFCCTRRSATASRATSIARRLRPSPACSVSGRGARRHRGRRRHARASARVAHHRRRARPSACTVLIEDGSWSATCRTGRTRA